MGRACRAGTCSVSLSNVSNHEATDFYEVFYLQGASFSCGTRGKGTRKVTIFLIPTADFEYRPLICLKREDIKAIAGTTADQDRGDQEKNKLLFN